MLQDDSDLEAVSTIARQQDTNFVYVLSRFTRG